MKNTDQIKNVLERMAKILRQSSQNDWAKTIERVCQEIDESPSFAAGMILSMYGGMGSMNDLVLYENGQILMEENQEFDMLRGQLYQLCRD